MVERQRNERMLYQNQNIETVGLKVKNQMLEQSLTFMKWLVVGMLTIYIVIMRTQEETQSENRKNKGKSSQVPSVKAHWDAKSNQIFIKLCVEEMKVGHRLGTHLDREGWENVMTKFKTMTGKTGLGCDTLTRAISTFDEWWTKKLERYPDVAKFRHMPLQFTEDLDILFSNAATTEEWAYTPSSGVMPNTDKIVEEFIPHMMLNFMIMLIWR
ncbi:L10-interacting MYB domain-containing protein [Camellia lanceoleosa]|uniref:L10-interacting MYB domain-containing protein n=1 Tax=Camellia lanceoleosa TaxID=1840588 RepID=A0ACC0I7C1_9ERIC|nr:L10-interacting MYB domain-containing protein [Camellia lanceoleosa]